MELLCLDAGSSSLKFAAYHAARAGDEPARFAGGNLPASGDADAWLDAALAQLPKGTESIAAVGHRIVFGGPRYVGPTLAGDAVLRDLESLVDIEPLHLRVELDLVYAARRRFPNATQVLCFDTAFHRSSPEIARRLPLPALDPLIQRYGFHGLSYEYIVSQVPSGAGRMIVAHLGSGASVCALRDRKPVDTSMGFSALGGLMMGTRPGDLDPGVVLRLIADGYDLARLTDLFYHRSGLLGVSESTPDMRTLAERSSSDAKARDAIRLFAYELIKHLGAMVAVLDGLETLVFTGGIGENDPHIRAVACAGFSHLGLKLDDQANQRNDRVISEPQSAVTVMVIPTDENLMIARHTLAVLGKK